MSRLFSLYGEGPQASATIDGAIHEVGRIVDICSSGNDDRARAQSGFWDRTLVQLHRDKDAGARGISGPCIEDLRWHALQFSRRADPSWQPLCARIDEYFEMRDQLQEVLHRYRSRDEVAERKVEIRELYEALVAATASHLEDLHAERLRLTGAAPVPSARELSPRALPDGSASRPVQHVKVSASSRSNDLSPRLVPTATPMSLAPSSRLTPTAPPLSSRFDAYGIAHPPQSIGDGVSVRKTPSPDWTAWRP